MSKHPKTYLNDILEHINRAQEFAEEMTYEELIHDIKACYAISRCFEIIGEATTRLPLLLREKYKILEDGRYFGWIDDLTGVRSNGAILSLCRQELQSVAEGWLLLGLKLGHYITPPGDIVLNEPVKAGRVHGR